MTDDETSGEPSASDWDELWGPLVARNLQRLRLVAFGLGSAMLVFMCVHALLVTDASTAVSEQILGARLAIIVVNLVALGWSHLVRHHKPTRAIGIGVSVLLAVDAAAMGVLIGFWEQLREVLPYQATIAVLISMVFYLPLSQAAAVIGASYLGMAITVLLTQPALPNLGGALLGPALLTLFATVLSHYVRVAGLRDRWARLTIERQRRRLALANAEARRMTKAAQAADRAKGEFLANMSHETRTPMTAILGMMELAQRTNLSGEQREYIETTSRSATALLRILDDILDLAKIEARRLELRPDPTDAARVVREGVAMLQRDAERARLAVSVTTEGLDSWVLIDPVRLGQITINLVSNAIKYTPQGEVAVRLTLSPCDEEMTRERTRGTLLLGVSDTGIGISEAEQQHIFEAFEQADSSSTRRHGGAGLGLSICRELVRLMEGRIWVESTVGSGSTFFVELPVLFTPPAITEPPAASPPMVVNRALHVLIAEDNRVNQRLLQRLLEGEGHRTTLVSDGAAALEALTTAGTEGGFDVALLDVQMPEADGTVVARKRRALERRDGVSPLPLVAVTARAMAGDREALLATGFDQYVAKPFTRAALLEAIAQALHLQPPSRPS